MALKRKVERGQPLTEEVTKGSYEYTARQIRRAFYRQHPDYGDEYLYVCEIFTDHIIVASEELAHDEFYYVTYQREGDAYLFAARDEWEVVELTYQPKTIVERLRERKGTRLVEVMTTGVRLDEAKAGKPRVVYGDGATADVINGNNRRYPLEVLVEAVTEARNHLHESLSQGRAVLLGEEDHPADKRQGPKLTETIVTWQDIWFDYPAKQVKLKGHMILNSKGQDAVITMEAGVLPGMSLRGYGESKLIEENGAQVEEVSWLRFTGFDLVMTPSFESAGITVLEAKRKMDPEEVVETEQAAAPPAVLPAAAPKKITAAWLRAHHPELVARIVEEEDFLTKMEEQQQKQLTEAEKQKLEAYAAQHDKALRAMLGIGETDDLEAALAERNSRLSHLEEAEQKRKVKEFIEKETADLKTYPDFMKANLIEAVGEPATVEEAKQLLIKNRKIFDKLAAEWRLRAKGFHGVDVLGPVLEREGQVPAYAQAAFHIGESLRSRQLVPARNRQENRQATIQEMLAAKYLERYDATFKHHLAREARDFEEAEQATDLNLPYSVMRTVIEEVYPMLISPVIFDYGVDAMSPMNIWFEQYVGETGETATVTNEDVVADTGVWVDMANKRVIPGTVVVENNGGGGSYSEGTDYVIDYEEGRFYALASGSLVDTTTYDVDYQYRAFRKGEMAPIERGKMTLSSQVLTQRADRVATQISREAVVFSRSQLGWDATARTISALIKELATKIDQDRLYKALAAALTVANNSGGTWVSATDTLQALVEKVGAAKVKVANRNYEPTSIVMSKTRSDTISNWDGFTAAGRRPDADVNAQGYVGRLKGLPVFESTQFSDSYILVLNRELVMARVFGPMQLLGPFPSYDTSTGELIAAEQYYVEEFNGSITPIEEKGAYVKIT